MHQHLRLLLSVALTLLFLAGCGQVPPRSPVALATPTTTSVTPSPPPFVQPPADFAFEFAYGSCFIKRLDTFTHTYTRDTLDNAPVITTSLTLAPYEMTTIYHKMVAIDFFQYPSIFIIPVPSDGDVGMVTPASTYHFVVQQNGETTMVAWLDAIVKPTTPEAERLRELATLMTQMIEAQPEVQTLPAPNVGCV